MIAIHQSQFLPWVPYFYKMTKSDVFVILDHVQFQKNGVQNRNMIKTPRGVEWLTVPVKIHFGQPINQIEIAELGVYEKMLKTLELNYKKSEFFKEVFEIIQPVFSMKLKKLNVLNIELLKRIIRKMGIRTELVCSSEMQLTGHKQDLIIEIIKKLGQREYLCGKGALSGYIHLDRFKEEGLEVYTQHFCYSEYKQLWDDKQGFIPDLSVIDLLFNYSPQALKYMTENGVVQKIS